jgi:hypothetical protein
MPSIDANNGKTARVAGLLYLIVVLTGMFSLAYVPSQLVLAGDAAGVVTSFQRNETLYRFGIMSSVLCYTAFLLLPLALYRLLSDYSKVAGAMMVGFAVVSVPLSFFNVLHQFEILSLLHASDYMQPFSRAQANALIMSVLQKYRDGLLFSKVFWGLWLAPFGYLVYKSGILPKLLGVLLMLGCIGYLVDFFGYLLFANYGETVAASYAGLPAAVGEIGICLWLLFMGAKNAAPSTTAQ